MYIGIYISDSFISVGSVNQDQEVVIIKDESITEGSKFLTPLKLYIENNYAFIGKQVDYLIAADENLNFAEQLIQDDDSTKTVYRDASGVSWDTANLIAIYLKKLVADIQIHNDQIIEGAVVTTTMPVTPTLTTILKRAFKTAGINLCGVMDLGKAALCGYAIKGKASEEQYAMLLNLDSKQLCLSTIKLGEDQYTETISFSSDIILGEANLLEELSEFILKRYQNIIQAKIKQNNKAFSEAIKISKHLLSAYFQEPKKIVFEPLCKFGKGPFIKLLITRFHLSKIMLSFESKLISAIKTHIEASNLMASQLDHVLITGTAFICKTLEKSFQKIDKNAKPVFYNLKQDQVITKGIALYANNPIEREIAMSLLTSSKDDADIIETDGIANTENKIPDYNQLEKLVKTIHINVGCDV